METDTIHFPEWPPREPNPMPRYWEWGAAPDRGADDRTQMEDELKQALAEAKAFQTQCQEQLDELIMADAKLDMLREVIDKLIDRLEGK